MNPLNFAGNGSGNVIGALLSQLHLLKPYYYIFGSSV
jgi:hypothetical protein